MLSKKHLIACLALIACMTAHAQTGISKFLSEQLLNSSEWQCDSITSERGSQYFLYDEHGNMISNKDVSGHQTMTCTYEYDAENRLICDRLYNSAQFGGKVPCNETTYTYDEQGRLIKTLAKIYDENGGVIDESEKSYVYNEDGTYKVGNITYDIHYDDNGNKILDSYSYTDSQGEIVIMKHSSEYDDHHNVKKTEDYCKNGSYESQSVGYYRYTYDEQGLLIKEERMNDEGVYEIFNEFSHDTKDGVRIVKCSGEYFTDNFYFSKKAATGISAAEVKQPVCDNTKHIINGRIIIKHNGEWFSPVGTRVK